MEAKKWEVSLLHDPKWRNDGTSRWRPKTQLPGGNRNANLVQHCSYGLGLTSHLDWIAEGWYLVNPADSLRRERLKLLTQIEEDFDKCMWSRQSGKEERHGNLLVRDIGTRGACYPFRAKLYSYDGTVAPEFPGMLGLVLVCIHPTRSYLKVASPVRHPSDNNHAPKT